MFYVIISLRTIKYTHFLEMMAKEYKEVASKSNIVLEHLLDAGKGEFGQCVTDSHEVIHRHWDTQNTFFP